MDVPDSITTKYSHPDREELRNILRSTTAAFEAPGHITHDLLAQIISLSSQAFVIGFPDGALGMMNGAFENLTGYTAEELKTVNWATTLTPPEWRDFEREKLGELNRTGQAIRYEKEYIKKNGERIPVELHVHLASYVDEKYYFGFVSDISERKNAEDALRQSEERLRSVLENATDFVYRFNLQTGCYDYLSPSAELVTSYTVADYSAMSIGAALDLIHPEDSERVRGLIKNLRPNTTTSIEYRLRAKNGLYRWISSRLTLVRDKANGAVYRYGSVRNIDEEKLAQGIISETTNRLLSVLDTTLDCIYRYDLKTLTYDYFSPASEKLLGFTPTQLMGMDELTVHSFVHPDDREKVRLAMERLETSQHEEFEYRRFVDGRGYRWFSHQISLISDSTGNRLYRTGTIRDISDRVAREQRDQYLSAASALLHATLDYEATLKTIAKLGVPQFADWCVVDMADEGSESIQHVALEHVDPAKIALGLELRSRYPTQLNNETGLGRVLRTGESTFVPLVTEEMIRMGAQDQAHYQILVELGFNSAMIVPLVAHGRVYGALSLIAANESGRIFTEDDLLIAEDIGRRAGLAIENSRLYEKVRNEELKQRHIAETLQMSLMIPGSSTDFNEFAIDTHYEAALDESLIGGDFGDVFRVDQNKIAVLIGDCTGKGLDAARFIGECQFTTRAFIRESPEEPGHALSRVNRMLLDDQRYDARPVTALASMAIAVIDTVTGAVILAVGGCEPPIVFRNKEKTAKEISVSGPMLGVLEDIVFNETRIQLGTGDILVMTTDGITEARDPNTRAFFDQEGVLKSVKNLGLSQGDLNGFAERIAADAKRFGAGHLTDDACIIAVKRNRS